MGKEAAKLPGFLLLSAAGAGWLAEALGISPDLAEAIQRRARTARLEQLISMEQFEATFQQVLRDILGSEGRLVVFVDDLDRCLPEKAVEVLEAIKLFLEVEGTVFVLGLDREVICRGIEVYYRRQGSEVPISGDDYLEKFIQIPFHLPPLDAEDLERLLEAAERGAQEPEWVDLEQYTEARRIDEAVRRILARGVGPNPRQAKRALNAFRLLQAVALAREARGTLPPETPWPILAKIVVLQTQYPEVYRHWLEPGMQDLPVHLERALETGEAPPEAPGRVREVIQNLLQDPVRSFQLREVLTYPPVGEERTHRRRARFGDLRPGELEWYRRLATPLTLPLTVGRAGPLEEALASGEPARLWQAALELRARPPEEQEYARWLLLRNRTLPEWARQRAQEILSAQDPLPFLARTLREADARRAATGALINIGPPALGPLVEALRDADAGVRWAAAEALGAIRDPAAVGPLVEALRDADAGVRQAAEEALEKIGSPIGLKAVEEARKRRFI
ncbi:MAG: P-loop NTPase fold protein [Anaerolineae bacterium]|nr:P-loop NTPase fold protein [Anaerolineae bacterium]